MRFIRKLLFKRFYVKPLRGQAYGSASIFPLLSWGSDKQHLCVAEVGVYQATSSIAMLETWNIDRFYAVDLWKPYAEYVAKEKSGTTDALLQNDGDTVFKETCAKLSKYPAVSIIREDSRTAKNRIEDGTLDFCFIDANHEYDYVVQDLQAWLPKIKKGGILAGHDYFHKPVRKAVRDTLIRQGTKVSLRGYHHSGYPSCWFTEIV